MDSSEFNDEMRSVATKDIRASKWVSDIARPHWEMFLDNCRRLFEELAISADDPRLAMNLRNDAGRRRLHVSMGKRLVLALGSRQPQQVIVMLSPGADERYAAERLKSFGEEEVFQGKPDAQLYSFPVDRATELFPQVMPELIDLCKEYVPKYRSSVYRKHHMPDLYRMAMEPDFRKAALDHLLEGKGEWPGGLVDDGGGSANYWVFQGNPAYFDTAGALRAGELDNWGVGAHKEKIKPGDMVILWVTGEQSGCYALATVTTPVDSRLPSEADSRFSTAVVREPLPDRVGIRVDHNLCDRPILKKTALALPGMEGFKGGNQGTTFTATKDQYNALLRMARQEEEAPVYFTSDELQLISTYAGTRYDGNDVAQRAAYDRLKTTYDKVTYWAKQVQQRVFPEGVMDVLRKPTNQANRFERYQWARIYPSTASPREVALVVSIQDHGRLVVHLNTVGIKDNDPRRLRYFDYRGDQEQSDIVMIIPEKEAVSLGWEELIRRSSEFVRTRMDDYERLVALVCPAKEVPAASSAREPMNLILYGPPGTGKTYALKERYFGRYTTRIEALPREQRLAELVKDLTWWEVAAMVLLDTGPDKAGAIMEHELLRTKAGLSNSANVRATVWGTLQMHTVNECELVKYTARQEPLIFNKREGSVWEVLESSDPEVVAELREKLESTKRAGDGDAKEVKRYEFVTFHQSFSYEDFIEGIKPALEDGDMAYEIKPGIFMQLCARAAQDPTNDYALFIDEINRGNVSAIFGELISLIELDKRAGMPHALSAMLPYSKKSFSVPRNLHIIGTMNTADRSVEALDTALRRRFSFEECPSRPELLKGRSVNGVDLEKLLTVINARIEMLLDRDHQIGHSYFLGWPDPSSEKKLRSVFTNNIVPLLQEYFYGDPVKVALVLGPAFVREAEDGGPKVKLAGGVKGADDIEPRQRYLFADPTDEAAVPLQAFLDICDGK